MSTSRLLSQKLLILISVILQLSARGSGLGDSLRHNKEIPAEFERPILAALSYFPELKDTHIIFRIKKAKKYFASKYCTFVFNDREGRLWVGTSDGLYKQNLRNSFFTAE